MSTGLDLSALDWLSVDPTDFNGPTPIAQDYDLTSRPYVSTIQNLDSITFTAPADGRILLIGTTSARGIGGTCTAILSWFNNPTQLSAAAQSFMYAPASGRDTGVAIWRQSVNKGNSYTYYLNVTLNQTTCTYAFTNVQYIFVPN